MSDVTIQTWYRHKIRSLYHENRELTREIRRLRRAGLTKGQPRKESAIEAVLNVAVGLIVSVGANLLVLPLFGYSPSFGDAFGIGLIFTAISLLRSYALRRLFNRRMNETLD